MSDKLVISAALSVLMMSAYVLLGADASRAPLGTGPSMSYAPIEIAPPTLPRVGHLLASPR